MNSRIRQEEVDAGYRLLYWSWTANSVLIFLLIGGQYLASLIPGVIVVYCLIQTARHYAKPEVSISDTRIKMLFGFVWPGAFIVSLFMVISKLFGVPTMIPIVAHIVYVVVGAMVVMLMPQTFQVNGSSD